MSNTQSQYQELFALTQAYGQEHLLRFWNQLDEAGQKRLAEQIRSVDFALMKDLATGLISTGSDELQTPLQKPKPLRGKAWEQFGLMERAAMANAGMRALREGKVAAFLVAGGQGTRLGHQGPKGTYDIGLPSGKSLFQLQAERIANLGRRCGRPVPWFIMTSADNHEATTSFFKDKGYFGLEEGNVFFFQQDQLPVVDAHGKILLDAPDALSMGPNGNGGCFLGLSRSGALAEMRRRGVEWVFTYSVDNALVKVCDPAFVGFAMGSGMPSASKAVAKAYPTEKVGVFALRENRPTVVEYSEMQEEWLHETDGQGRLAFGAGNIAIHLFRRDFLEREAASPLPYHVAHKKIAYCDTMGNRVTPDKPNAYKFELFMFDLFPRAEGMAILEVAREEEFAPVKNKEGQDSPSSARELLFQLHRKWAEATVPQAIPQRLEGVEISPLVSYAGEGLESRHFQSAKQMDLFWVVE